MPSFSLRRLSSVKGNKTPQNLTQSITTTSESNFVIPLSLSMSTSTLGTVSTAQSSTATSPSDYAEMLDDDNLAWGPTKPRKSKKTPNSKRF